MTPAEFRAWRGRPGLSVAWAAKALGLSARQIHYCEARHREDGRLVAIPRTVELACKAIEAGLETGRTGAGVPPTHP